MNARPSTIYVEPEEWLLTLSRWQRQSEALVLNRLYGAPEAAKDDDEDGDGGLPPLAPLDDEYSWASALGRAED